MKHILLGIIRDVRHILKRIELLFDDKLNDRIVIWWNTCQ